MAGPSAPAGQDDSIASPGATALRLFERDVGRARAVRKVLASCGLIARSFRGAGQLEPQPDDLRLVLIHDSEDEQSDELVEACIARGHGAILYSECPRLERVNELLVKGAVGYLAWPFGPAEVREALDRIEAMGVRRLTFLARQAHADALCETLTRRERQVLVFLMESRTSKEIGQELGISNRTVEVHRAGVLAKLGGNAAAALRYAVYADLDRARPTDASPG